MYTELDIYLERGNSTSILGCIPNNYSITLKLNFKGPSGLHVYKEFYNSTVIDKLIIVYKDVKY